MDITFQTRRKRPQGFVDYTAMTNRRRYTTDTAPSVSVQAQPETLKVAQKPITQKHKVTVAHKRQRFSEVALQAVKLADPSIEEMTVDVNPVYIERPATKRKVVSGLLYTFGVIVMLASLAVSVNTFLINQQAKDQVQALGETTYSTDRNGVQEGTGSDPAESPVGEDALLNYFPNNPQDPRYIRIPSIGVISRVKTLGVDETNKVDAPHNIHDAGWYNGSVRPGSGPGTSLLLGHVSGWTSPGVFKKIDALQADDKIIIENGEGRTFTYHVYKTETKHVNDIDMNKVLATEKAGEHVIKLMTCAGNFDSDSEQYDSRTIVYAKQIL